MNNAIAVLACPLVLLVSCVPAGVAPTPAACPQVAAPEADGPLGSVDGIPILRSDLPPEVLDELKSMQNEALQRKLHLQWVAVDESINQKLLAREAERRQVTVAALLAEEVDGKLVDPTDEEVAELYGANKENIPIPLEIAAPHLTKELRKQRREELERAYVETLRAGADIRYALSVPELPRFDVQAGGSPSSGPADAKVVIIEFSDFECPYCGRASRIISELQRLYPDSLRVVFRNFPLTQHPNARPAAEAAHCAHEQGKFWAYHDLLFDNSRALAAADLRKYAEQGALDLAAFDACLASDRPKTAVDADEQAARSYQLDGTPSIFISGIKLIGILPLPLITAIIDRELGRTR